MVCKFCGNQKAKLIKAHIVPACFYREIKKDSGPLLIAQGGEHNKKSPTGVYDKNILCATCDGKIGKWDNIAIQFFTDTSKWLKKDAKGETYYEIWAYDYKALKLFFISLIWKASVSKNTMYKYVNLGPFEQKALNHLRTEDPGSIHDFSVILYKFSSTIDPNFMYNSNGQIKAMLNPVADRKDGFNYYRFYLNEFILLIKVDKRPLKKPFLNLALEENKPLFIMEIDFDASLEKKWMLSVIASVR